LDISRLTPEERQIRTQIENQIVPSEEVREDIHTGERFRGNPELERRSMAWVWKFMEVLID